MTLTALQREQAARQYLPKAIRMARRFERRCSGGDPESAATYGLAYALTTYDGSTALNTWVTGNVLYQLQLDRWDRALCSRRRGLRIAAGEPAQPWELRPVSVEALLPAVEALAAFPETPCDLWERVEAALRELPEEQARLLWRHYAKGETRNALAAEYRIPPGTLAGRTLKARRDLKALVDGDRALARLRAQAEVG